MIGKRVNSAAGEFRRSELLLGLLLRLLSHLILQRLRVLGPSELGSCFADAENVTHIFQKRKWILGKSVDISDT
jgi:hypothetical protein